MADNPTKMWIPASLRKLAYERKAKYPDKNLTEILDELVEEIKDKEQRRGSRVFPKF